MVAVIMKQFSLGHVASTPGALEVLREAGQTPLEFLQRHITGDWGDLEEADKNANEQALIDGDRILSSYILNSGVKIWVITEADRSSTCILLPSEC